MKNVFLCVAVIIQITACKKGGGTSNNPPPPANGCRIVKIAVSPYYPPSWILKYNDAGKLVAIDDVTGNVKREITYEKDSYTMIEYNGPSIKRTLEGDLSNDRVTFITEKRYEYTILQHTIKRGFTYYTTGELKRIQVDIDTNTNYMETTYDWAYGNLVHEMINSKPSPPPGPQVVPTAHTYNTYDTQKELPAGDGFNACDLTRFEELLMYGRFIIKNKNPLIKQTYSQQGYNDFSRTFTYEFDIKGNVTKITGTWPESNYGSYTIAYTYECD
jgi:hypothetical protein